MIQLLKAAIVDSGFVYPSCHSFTNEEIKFEKNADLKFVSGDFLIRRYHRDSFMTIFHKRKTRYTAVYLHSNEHDDADFEKAMRVTVQSAKALKMFVNDYVIPHLYKPPNGRMFIRELAKLEATNKNNF